MAKLAPDIFASAVETTPDLSAGGLVGSVTISDAHVVDAFVEMSPDTVAAAVEMTPEVFTDVLSVVSCTSPPSATTPDALTTGGLATASEMTPDTDRLASSLFICAAALTADVLADALVTPSPASETIPSSLTTGALVAISPSTAGPAPSAVGLSPGRDRLVVGMAV